MNRPADPAHISAWQRIDAGLTTSGYLTASAPADLAAIGTQHVINLALADHPRALANEREQFTGAGIGYTHIPIPFDAPDEAHFAAFREAMADAARPVHIHCIANWRVSALLYRYHREVAGMPEPDARALLVQQWDPAGHDHPDAATWARFIGL